MRKSRTEICIITQIRIRQNKQHFFNIDTTSSNCTYIKKRQKQFFPEFYNVRSILSPQSAYLETYRIQQIKKINLNTGKTKYDL